MKKSIQKLKKRVYTTLDLPMEADETTMRLTVVGRNALLLENHGGVLLCGEQLIRLRTQQGALRISGTELTMAELSKNRVFIRGLLNEWAFEDTHPCGIP